MIYFNVYLDELIRKKRLKNDSELAAYLSVSRQHLSRIRKGGLLSDSKCYRIAEDLGLNPLELFAYNQAQKADSPETRTVWMDLHLKYRRQKAYLLLDSDG
ncbi:MAG: helix-turn-helix domain-containing protein [Proteobacteria bacterium]|nr:helix-turn-helix domain-containing protein [Pseudomonadota bacterium]MDA0926634.1 helix-turn-helix domain-containing protein [Pseudomonadota bacterium]